MTAQCPERLLIDGVEHALLELPLETRFSRRRRRPHLQVMTTGCWRGYIGIWTIENSRLYLTELQGNLRDGSPLSLQTVFPDASGPVFAEWFTGELRIPTGDMVRYIHMGFESRYASERILRVERGIIITDCVRNESSQTYEC